MAKDWIKGAIKRPGQLHRDLGVPQGKTIPGDKMKSALAGQFGKATTRRARLARTLKGFKKS
jgi:hypothetical protein